MWITSSFKGEVVGEKRSITVPSRSIRNLAKFHLMLSRRAPNMPPFDALRYLYKGAWFGPFTSICNSFATGFSSITKLAKLLRSYCQLSIYPLENLILVSRIKGVDSMDFRFNKTFQSAAWESSLEFMVFSISNRMSVRKMHGGAWSWPCQRWGTQPCICYKRILWFVHCFQVPGCQIGLMEMPTPQNLIQYTWATHNPACSLISISHICHQRLGEMDFSQIDHRTQDLKQWLQSSAFCAATLASLSSQCDCNFEVWSQMFRNYPFACTCHKAL